MSHEETSISVHVGYRDQLHLVSLAMIRNPMFISLAGIGGWFPTFPIPKEMMDAFGVPAVYLVAAGVWAGHSAVLAVLGVIATWVATILPMFSRGVLGEHTFILEEDGLVEVTIVNRTKIPYSTIDAVTIGKDYVLIRLGMNFYYLPARDGTRDAIAFGNDIKSRIIRSRQGRNSVMR